ncbi:lysylphosphatidylglycerol synthase transmembrane domain-containing protein [Spirosoma sp.]|uniref:lysylphosphatidylglycerol synthase transmembrane domain-containing protein n=1 Tax=Spirosoma sp. TaxID=1899569 RepID=UPI00260E1661|nr:lysylphosphatidylglycerol synthase transmembrane domain-containing protein [Spirosoma sp.]MCX6217133.1 lysylphosphatidylglycerol synthase transmembrane domain-containing protein [Spirosoma sp.]
MNIKNVIKYLVSLAIAGGLLWFTFQQSHLDAADLWQKIKGADYRWVLLSAVFTIIAHWSRAERWRILLEPVIAQRPTSLDTTASVLTGYLANLALPRAGEFVRCGTLYRLSSVPVNVSFGAVVAERLFDLLMLVLLLIATFVLEFDRISQFFIEFLGGKLPKGSSGSGLLLLAAVVIAGLALLAWFLFNRYREALGRHPLYQKVSAFVKGLLDGLLSVRKIRRPGAFVFHTLLIWTMYYLMSYTLFFAMPATENLGPLAGLTILMVGTLGMAAPTPGGIGSFHLLVGQVALLYGLTSQDGQVLATFIHGVSTLMIIILGIFALLVVLLRRNKATQEVDVLDDPKALRLEP